MHVPDEEEARFLEEYKTKTYPKPSVTADIAVFRRGEDGPELLMIRRGGHPYRGCWALPGGFAEPGEDVMQTAQRELAEETGIAGVPVELYGMYGAPGRDPRGWTVSGGFCTVVDDTVAACAGDDAADARWCPLRAEQLPEASVGDAPGNPPDGSAVIDLHVDCGTGEALHVLFRESPQRFGAPRAVVLESEGFAFDHELLVSEAYLKVRGSLA